MNLEKDSFTKYFSENRNEYNDPKLKEEKGSYILSNNGLDKMNLIGNLFIVLLVPIIICLVILNKEIPKSINYFLIGLAVVWFVVTLYKRVQKIMANNNVIFDLENRLVKIEPQDYFRRKILKIQEHNYSFNSIRGIKTKTRDYDKYNAGLRLVMTHGKKEIILVDIWNKKLGTELNQFLQHLFSE